MNAPIAPTPEETRTRINQGIAEVNAKIRALLASQGQLALEAAEGNPDAAKRLADTELEISGLMRERRMLEKALEALTKRERINDLRASLAEIESDRAAAHAVIAEVNPAFRRVVDLLAELGPAWRKLKEVEIAARTVEISHRQQSHNDLVTGNTMRFYSSFNTINVQGVALGFLRQAVGDPTGEYSENPDVAQVESQVLRSLEAVEAGLGQHEANLRKALAEAKTAE